MNFDRYIDLILIHFEDVSAWNDDAIVDFKIKRQLLNEILTDIYNSGYKDGSDYCIEVMQRSK